MTWPPHFFQLLATSSSTFSAKPSSLHAEPQCFPTKVASAWRADDVSVRLCFLVNVRNASGRSVAGGSSMGSTVDLTGGFSAGGARIAVIRRGLMGWAGVPKAGEDDGIGFAGTAEGFSGRRVVAIVVCIV